VDSVDLDVLRRMLDWLQAGRRVQLATIVRSFGSAPRPVGAMLAVAADGRFAGSVSGGCVEDDLIARMQNRDSALPELARYGITEAQSRRYGLPCGGQLELIVEGFEGAETIAAIVAAIEARQLIRRRLNLADGHSQLLAADGHEVVRVQIESVDFLYGPRWRLIIIGAGQLSRYTAQLAYMLGYHVTVCDPRPAFGNDFEGGGDTAVAEIRRDMPDDLIREARPDARTAVVALSHDPKLDDMALLEALGSDAFYVGALGSRRNQEKRRQRLKEHFNVPEDRLAALHGPVGLPLGSRSPPEIAVAVLAEITALRNGVTLAVPNAGESATGLEADRAAALG
jgi:xanthine dehydrogenase accessory factor